MTTGATRRAAIAAGLAAVTGWSASAMSQVAPAAPDKIEIGDWRLAPMAEVRARGEFRRDLDEENHAILATRARIGIDAERGPVEGRIVIQDARSVSLGATADPVLGAPSVAVTGAYEAWVEAHSESARPNFVRIGRQAITWGEGRLLGAADWSSTGRSIDAARGRFVLGDGAVELLAAALVDPETSASLFAYAELLGARVEWAFDPLLAIDAYALARTAQENPSYGLDGSVRGQTYVGSLRLHGDGLSWSWGAEGAYEMGRADDLGAERAAWAATGHVAYAFESVTFQPSLRIGISYASGDSGGSTYRAFDPILPDVHAWNGAMDLFAWSNEEEQSARVSVAPSIDASLAIEYRYARLAQPGGAWRTDYLSTIGRAPGNTKADLGHELDAVLRWSPWVPVALEVGYGLFLLGDGARAILAANAIGRLQAAGTLSTPAASHFAYAEASLALP